jgi:heme A synthase
MQRFAVALASLTFGLVILGGIVHNTGSSLACPDWPLCNGTAFPHMIGGVLIEHSHRLVAGTVVVMTAVMFFLLIVAERSVAAVGGLALGLVVAQAALGAVTVLFRLPPAVSTGHLATSMLFFSTVIYLAFRLRRTPSAALPPHVRRATLVAAALVYVQMVLGAAVRHLGAGLACVDLPLCRGSLFPTGVDVTVQLHALHRLLAVFVFGYLIYMAAVTFRSAQGRRAVRALAVLAPVVATLQITLGVLTITSFRDFVPLTAHLGVAAALLCNVVSLHLLSRGPLGARQAATPREAGPVAEAAA